mmetsp:Transcript_24050/g.61234  ORF Transcript_24050/g.61234 Transcript_24050/m.61234 type:complete len:221 (-) Transcript_24050:711-1373(-)
MVFSAAIYSNTTTGNLPREPVQAETSGSVVDKQPNSAVYELSRDKHDVMSYTLYNAPIIGLAGLATGLQEAFYKYEKMAPAASRQTFSQAATLYGIVGRKTLYATALGALFCYAEATLENARGHKMSNGIAAGALTGLAFGLLPPKPLPQPIAWPIIFATGAAVADLAGEYVPWAMRSFRTSGPLETRPNWNDPVPPRPPIMETGASVRPGSPAHFMRGA